MSDDDPYVEFELTNRETHKRALSEQDATDGIDPITSFIAGTWPDPGEWFECPSKDGQSTHYIRRASVVSFRYVKRTTSL